jgi:hypothetical protein
MSELRDTMADVVADRAPGTTSLVKNLSNGAMFRAEVEPIEDITLLAELGVDPRASCWLHVERRITIWLKAGDQLMIYGKTFQILPKAAPNNAAMVQDKYLLIQLADKDAK